MVTFDLTRSGSCRSVWSTRNRPGTPLPVHHHKLDLQANAPGEFALEVELGQTSTGNEGEQLEMSVGASIGFHQEEGEPAVLLSFNSGNKSISLSVKPDDIAALKDAVGLLHDRLTADESTLRADNDQQADCS